MDHGRSVVFGVDALASRIRQNRSPQHIIRMQISLPHTGIDHLADTELGIPTHFHADFQKYRNDAGVLTNRPPTFRAHSGIDQNLRHRIFGRRALFLLISRMQCLNEIQRVVIGNVLQGIGDALDKIVLANSGHDEFSKLSECLLIAVIITSMTKSWLQ